MTEKDTIQELLSLTRPFVGRPDLIQGPGGNTSVKDKKGHMYIKASGLRFSEMNEANGFSAVNALSIADYFRNVEVKSREQSEKDSLELITASILEDANGIRFPKPSMETGFHAVLDKYVVHTHSVWTNLVNCNLNSKKLIGQLQKDMGQPVAYIPFVSPGFVLSWLITLELQKAEKNGTERPAVFFLENHGVIAHGESVKEVEALLSNLDTMIAKLFGLQMNAYPSTLLEKHGEDFVPVNDYCSRIIKKYNAGTAFFGQVLFPDQTVFFKDAITWSGEAGRKIRIAAGHTLAYRCREREAASIHETMTAYLFLFDTLSAEKQEIRLIKGEEIDYINNMDMEKHRKDIMKNS